MIRTEPPFTREQIDGILFDLFGFEPNPFYMRFMPVPKLRLSVVAVRATFPNWCK
jgi:hypothetical protein